MDENIEKKHNDKIIEQFSKQAVPFTKIKGHYDSVDTIISMSEVMKNDIVLDIACGTGILTSAFAKYANSVVGIDITQSMLNEAIKKQKKENIIHIKFDLGGVESLPYEDNSFDIVFTRYSFHHFLDTKNIFDEMIRVCKVNGRIIVVDATPEDKSSSYYNYVEKLRDPSHTKALTFDEFNDLFSNKVLSNHKHSSYKVDMELESLLDSSFPNDGNVDKIREIFKNDIEINRLGMNTRYENDKIYLSYPITILMANKLSI